MGFGALVVLAAWSRAMSVDVWCYGVCAISQCE
jgi:hypothetical protein